MFYTESVTIKAKIGFLRSIWNKIMNTFELIGSSRAAAELARLGRHEEANRLILRAAELKRRK